jgi:GAF domain/ANTAR domain
VAAADACEVAAVMAGVDGAWLTAMSDPARRVLVHATGARAAELEELQFTLGEGPCVDAFSSGLPVLAPDLEVPGWQVRWPAFAIAGAEVGMAAVFAFPLVLGAIRVGVLGLYREVPGSLSAAALADVLTCADVALQLLLNSRAGPTGDSNGRAHHGNGTERSHDGWAWDSWPDGHARVYQATGMVSAQRQVRLEEALALLRAYAFSHDRTLDEVAAAVVDRRLRLDQHEPGEPDD